MTTTPNEPVEDPNLAPGRDDPDQGNAPEEPDTLPEDQTGAGDQDSGPPGNGITTPLDAEQATQE